MDPLNAAVARLDIEQLAVRYAIAIDSRDLDLMVAQWVPNVWMGKAHGAGHDAVRRFFEPVLRRFYRSMHMIVGHRIDLVDDDHAVGQVYCRAEHESGDNWVVQAIVYDDTYRRVEGRWGFATRRHHHWYSTPIERPPAPPSFENWPEHPGPLPDLPHLWPSWHRFWADVDERAICAITAAPGPPTERAPRRVSTADRVEIHELAARYGHAIDDRDWTGLSTVFTHDAILVLRGDGDVDQRLDGVDAIRSFMRARRHPVAHHVTNVVVVDVGGDVRMRSKIIAPGPGDRISSADYDDRLRRTTEGWRIAERLVRPRGTHEQPC